MTVKSERRQESNKQKLFVPEGLIPQCMLEADAKYPLETGGTFLGWWADSNTAVVMSMVGPGPNADYGRVHFQPDQTWQLEQIAREYERSGRRHTYLGDWHSHPDATFGSPSKRDRKVLRDVIKTPSARCATPLMMILWGTRENWSLTTWQARLFPRLLLRDKLLLYVAQINKYARPPC